VRQCRSRACLRRSRIGLADSRGFRSLQTCSQRAADGASCRWVCLVIISSSNLPHRIPVVVPLPLPTPLATPPLVPLVVPVPVIPPLAMPLPLAPRLAGGAGAPPLVLPLAGVLADGTLLYLLGGLDVVGGCSTKDVSVVRKVASTSGGACCVGMWRSEWCLELGEVKVLARAKDCGVGAWRVVLVLFYGRDCS
jgi:hypothetical protein